MPLLVIIAVGVYATLGLALCIALILRRRGHLGATGVTPGNHPIPHGWFWSGSVNFAIWEWREARWRLAPGNLPPDADPGPPPGYPGAFEGEIIKTWVQVR